MTEFKVGDEVIRVRHYMREEPTELVRITKIGRKYAYVNDGSTPYDLATGSEMSEYRGHSSIRTKERHERIQADVEARKILRSWGVTLDKPAWDLAVEIRAAIEPILRTTHAINTEKK